MLNFGKYSGNELQYIKRFLDTENPENKNYPWVQKFEEKFIELSGSKYAIAVNSATSGLHSAIIACDLKPGDEVIAPAITVVMNSVATIISGFVPVFADINPKTWNIDIDTILPKVTNRTKVIMPVSLFGLPVDIDPIMKFAKEKNIKVIDDSAETMMGFYKNKFAGTHADIAVYSFENKKHITSGGEGGMVITSNSDLATKVRRFAGIGYKNLTASTGRTSLASEEFQNPIYKRHNTLGLNYRMTPLTACVGLAQLERVEEIVERRKMVAGFFLEAVKDCSWMIKQDTIKEANHTYYTAGFAYLGEKQKSISWTSFYKQYRSLGGDGFYSAWVSPYLEDVLYGKKYANTVCKEGLCPIAEDLQKKIMLFKTNYRNLDEAKRQAEILSNLIDKIGRD